MDYVKGHRESFEATNIHLFAASGSPDGRQTIVTSFRGENALAEGVLTVPLLETMMVLHRKADQKTETVEAQNRSKPIALGPITSLTITQNHDPRLSAERQKLPAFLDGQDTHRRNSLGSTFLPKNAIFTQSEAFEGTQAFNATFFFIVALKPDLMIRMGCRQSLKKGRRAIPMEVDCTDNTGNQVKCQSR